MRSLIRRSASLVARRVSGAWPATSRAKASARAISAGWSGSTSESRPSAFASSASTRREVKMISFVRAGPISAARRV